MPPQSSPARRRTGRRPHGRRAAGRTFLTGRPGACLSRGAGRRRRVLRSGGWLPANSPQSLREQVHDNLRRLGLDVLDVVNLRTLAGIDDRATVPGELARQFEALAELQQQGLIRHLGLSTVSLDQLAEAQRIAPVVCVQSFFNIANRADAAVLAATAEQHIAYVPYFPLGSFSPLQSDAVESVAKRLGATPIAVAESWLLQRSPNVMLIPGTSSVGHLRENVAGAAWPCRPTPPSWTRSEQWTPAQRIGSAVLRSRESP